MRRSVQVDFLLRTLVSIALLFCGLCAQSAAYASASGTIAYEVMGTHGQALARAITHGSHCPEIRINGKIQSMALRAAPALEPQRPTISAPELSKPSDFRVLTCEALIPAGSTSVSVAGQSLPIPQKLVRRIVVIGDTGCRLKQGDNTWQACNDAQQYPFARIAAQAARWRPDLVVHVGDYLYRENPCPDKQANCAGSPWGYGYDSWQADFFAPASILLHAAPWVVVRGNHESCNRAGQGWWRFLDPHPLVAGRDCNLADQDGQGDLSDAYAVPLGQHAQIIVLDTSDAPKQALSQNDPRAAHYQQLYRQMAQLAQPTDFNFVANHQPLLGFSAKYKNGSVVMQPGNAALQSAFAIQNPRLFPDSIDVLMSGHVHAWEQIGFSNGYPSQFVAGFSGTQEDIVPMPEKLPANATPAVGARVSRFSSWINGFGYMTLERIDAQRWKVNIWNVAGQRVNTCHIMGQVSICDIPQVHPDSQLDQLQHAR